MNNHQPDQESILMHELQAGLAETEEARQYHLMMKKFSHYPLYLLQFNKIVFKMMIYMNGLGLLLIVFLAYWRSEWRQLGWLPVPIFFVMFEFFVYHWGQKLIRNYRQVIDDMRQKNQKYNLKI